MLEKPHYYLDLTQDLCPMTFIKTKLMLERMQSGQTCEVHLQSAEPITGIAQSLVELGHKVVDLGPVSDQTTYKTCSHRFLVTKASIAFVFRANAMTAETLGN